MRGRCLGGHPASAFAMHRHTNRRDPRPGRPSSQLVPPPAIGKAPLPFVLGQEGAGAVTSVGSDVKSVKVGDRVAWTGLQGSYAEYAAVPADRLVPIPQAVNDHQAAAAMLQGMTAHYLSHDTYPLKGHETALIHAAAGGVGLLLVQMAHNIGARVRCV